MSDPPEARSFNEGDQLVAVKEIAPTIPVGTRGEVLLVQPDLNLIYIQWNIPHWPFVKVTKGTPTNGYERVQP